MDLLKMFNEIMKELNHKKVTTNDIISKQLLQNKYRVMLQQWSNLKNQGIDSPYLDYITIYETCMQLRESKDFKFAWWLEMRNHWLNLWRSKQNV